MLSISIADETTLHKQSLELKSLLQKRQQEEYLKTGKINKEVKYNYYDTNIFVVFERCVDKSRL